MHVRDLIEVEGALGYRYEIPDSSVEHYQWICPPCRRAMTALAQGRLRWCAPPSPITRADRPVMPIYANPGLGEGPLGEEDARYFHP
jgi:hypothetical protein